MAGDPKKIITELLMSMEASIDYLEGSVPKIEGRIMSRFQGMMSDLDTLKDGTIKPTVKNLRKVNEFQKEMRREISASGWDKTVNLLEGDLQTIQGLQYQYFDTVSKGYAAGAFMNSLKDVTMQQISDSLLGSGLDANVVDKASTIIQRNITEKTSLSDLVSEMSTFIQGNEERLGVLRRYSRQIVTDSLNQYAAQLNKTFTDDLGLQWYRYVGSLVNDSREWCVAMVAKEWIHESELPVVTRGRIDGETVSLAGLMPGTNATNVQVRRGGYNCNHMLLPVADEAVPKRVKDQLGKEKAPKQEQEDDAVFEEKKVEIPKDIDAEIKKTKQQRESLVKAELKKDEQGDKNAFDKSFNKKENELKFKIRKLEELKKNRSHIPYDDVMKKAEELNDLNAPFVRKVDTGFNTTLDVTYTKGKKIGSSPDMGDLFELDGDGYLFRGVSNEDYKRIIKQGYLDTDMRGAISSAEGMNFATNSRTAFNYLPENSQGVVMVIKPSQKSKYFMIGADDYVRTNARIPLNDIKFVTSPIYKGSNGYSTLIKNGRTQVFDIYDFTIKNDKIAISKMMKIAPPVIKKPGDPIPSGVKRRSTEELIELREKYSSQLGTTRETMDTKLIVNNIDRELQERGMIKTVENDALAASKKWSDSLSQSDKDIIDVYNSQRGIDRNYSIRTGLEMGDQDMIEIKRMEQMLKSAPKFQGESFRGAAFWNDQEYREFADLFVKDKLFTDKAFFATSINKDAADWFAKWGNHHVMIHVKGKNGVYIGDLQNELLDDLIPEQEVVFNLKSKFKVLDVKEKLIKTPYEDGSGFRENFELTVYLEEL